MSDGIPAVAEILRELREQSDPVSEARKEVLPYARRVKDALGALRALVTDDTPTPQLESDLRVVHGIVAALTPVSSGEPDQRPPSDSTGRLVNVVEVGARPTSSAGAGARSPSARPWPSPGR